MLKILFFFIFSSAFVNVTCYSKVYDCFIFFNELELLKVRLEELNPYVDKFVLVESHETFSGKDKPLYYSENKELFKEFEDKIIHVVLPKTNLNGTWQREAHQRNQIVRGLQGCQKDDIIMVSDLDEIPRGSQLNQVIKPISNIEELVVFCQHQYYGYYFNMKQRSRPEFSSG